VVELFFCGVYIFFVPLRPVEANDSAAIGPLRFDHCLQCHAIHRTLVGDFKYALVWYARDDVFFFVVFGPFAKTLKRLRLVLGILDVNGYKIPGILY
jgi:hypothetical protein